MIVIYNHSIIPERDLVCLLATSAACLTLGVEVGLLVGVAINIAQLMYIWARPSISIQVKVINTPQNTHTEIPDK